MRRFKAIGATFALLFASGCSSLLAPQPDRTRFFILAPADVTPSSSPVDIALGLGPVKFPDYLDRFEMVTRVGENRVKISSGERWAEPLNDNFVRVLAQDLYEQLGTKEIITYPSFVPVSLDYEIPIAVLRFECDDGGTARLDARWAVKDAKSDKIVFVTESHLVEPAAQPGGEGRVAALSQAVAKLSTEIAAEIRRLAQQ